LGDAVDEGRAVAPSKGAQEEVQFVFSAVLLPLLELSPGGEEEGEGASSPRSSWATC
jgi:hypothetical protein